MYFLIKTLITALIVAGVSELSRRYSLLAAALASLPLTSILAFIWVYYDSRDTEKVAALSWSVLWLVIPSLLFFVMFPILLRMGVKFTPALIVSCMTMSIGYAIFIFAKKYFA